jgi:hypothetical protein
MADLVTMAINAAKGKRGEAIYDPLLKPAASATLPAPVPPLDPRMTSIEERRMKTLEPSTKTFVVAILAWARANGIPALLGETHRSQADQARAIEEGKSAIKEGQTGWHQYGRAFHLVIIDPRTRLLDEEAYKRVGAEVRRRGGEWLGDKTLTTNKGQVQDLAHFEYHPGLKLSSYRGSALAKKELAMAEKRAARYG